MAGLMRVSGLPPPQLITRLALCGPTWLLENQQEK